MRSAPERLAPERSVRPHWVAERGTALVQTAKVALARLASVRSTPVRVDSPHPDGAKVPVPSWSQTANDAADRSALVRFVLLRVALVHSTPEVTLNGAADECRSCQIGV